MASGARISKAEDVDLLLKDLDDVCRIYLNEMDVMSFEN